MFQSELSLSQPLLGVEHLILYVTQNGPSFPLLLTTIQFHLQMSNFALSLNLIGHGRMGGLPEMIRHGQWFHPVT